MAFAVFVEIGIFGIARAFVVVGLAVPLDLVVIIRSPAFDEVPVGFSGEGVGGAVELVAPDELPFGLGAGWGESQEQGEGGGESDHDGLREVRCRSMCRIIEVSQRAGIKGRTNLLGSFVGIN